MFVPLRISLLDVGQKRHSLVYIRKEHLTINYTVCSKAHVCASYSVFMVDFPAEALHQMGFFHKGVSVDVVTRFIAFHTASWTSSLAAYNIGLYCLSSKDVNMIFQFVHFIFELIYYMLVKIFILCILFL